MPTIKLTGYKNGRIAAAGDGDDATLDGNLVVGDADTDSIIVNADFDSHLIPDDDNTYDLGSEFKRWRNIAAVTYYGDGSNLDNVSTDPAGNDGQVQFNDGGVFGGGGHFYYKAGRVGIGDFSSDTPDTFLHIKGNFGGLGQHGILTIEDFGFPPTIYFNANDGDGQNPAGVSNGDTLGALYFKGYNPTAGGMNTGASIRAIVDNTPNETATDMPTSLRFEVSGDGLSNPQVRMCLASTGRLGIGTISPTYQLDVDGTGIRSINSAGALIAFGLSGNTNPFSGILLGQLRWGTKDGAYQAAACIEAYTGEDWVTTYGSYLSVKTTQNGATTNAETMRISNSEITLKAPTVIESIATVEQALYVEGSNGVVVNNGSGQVVVQSTSTGFETKMTLSTVETSAVKTNSVVVNTDMSGSVPSGCSLIAYSTGVDAIVVNSGGNSNEGFLIYDGNNQVPFSITDEGRTYIGTRSEFSAEHSNWEHPMNQTDGIGNGVYLEGNNDEGPCFLFANRSTNSDSDGVGIIIGKGSYGDSAGGGTVEKDMPSSNNTYLIFYSKRKAFGQPTSSEGFNNPLAIGAVRGDGSGGISIDYSFTGKHASVMVLDETTEIGMIVESTGEIWHNGTGVSTALPKVSLSKSNNSKKVYGVIATLSGNFDGYVAASPLLENETHIEVNSLGEGKVWVTNLNGNIENGDYITSSEIAGFGQLQNDDLLHSYTVAKCTQNIDWDSIADTAEHNGQTYKKVLIACTYHCG